MSFNQEGRDLDEENPSDFGLRRSKRNKYHLDVAAVIKSGGCSSSGRNYSPPAKRKWASRRPGILQTPILREESATQQQKVSPRRNDKRKQLEKPVALEKEKIINKELECQKYGKEDKQNNQIEQLSNTDAEGSLLKQKPEIKAQQGDVVRNNSTLTDAIIEDESESTELVVPTEFLQSPVFSDQSSCQLIGESKRVRKDIKVEYMLTDGSNTFGGSSCPRCPAIFESRVGLTNHIKLHGSKKVLPCEICDFSCTNKKTMRQHRRVHGLIRRRRNPALILDANLIVWSSENSRQFHVLDSSIQTNNSIGIAPTTINNNIHNQMEDVQQNIRSRIDLNIKMEEARGEDSCEEPIIVISSLDEINAAGNADLLTTRQPYGDTCFPCGSNGEDVMPVLEQIMPTSNNLHISTGKELTISDLDMKTGKGENKIYIAQNKRREEKKGNKRLLNLDAIEGLKDLDENSLYIKKESNSTKIYDRNTVHCPKCPFRTQSRLRLAPHMAGHERQDQTIFVIFKNESSGLLRRHCQMHENDGVICKWPPDYVGAPSLSKSNNRHGSPQKKQIIKTECNVHNGNRNFINSQKKALYGNVGSGDAPFNPFVSKNHDGFLTRTKSLRISGPFLNSFYTKKLCKFSCRWCAFLFWSGPAGLLLHKLRHHPRMDKQRSVLYKELLLERLNWKPPKPEIKNNVISPIINDSPAFDLSNDEDQEPRITTPRNFPYRCRHCPYSTDQILRLQKHENKHIFKAEHCCQQCSYSCRSMHILMQHSRLHEVEPTSSSTTSLSSFRFPEAGTSSCENQQMPSDDFHQEDVQQHFTPSSPRKEFFRRRETNFCPHCPYKSKHNCDMKAHLKMHVERRKFACRHCTYSTMRQNALISHEKLHQIRLTDKGACRRVKWIYAKENGERSAHLGWRMRILRSGWHFYRCSIVECGAEFAFCAELVQHSRHHHLAWWKKKNEIVARTKNLIRCTICGFRTSLEMRMRDHEAVHQNDGCKNVRSVGGVFNCRECPYSTANYAKFWNHRQKHKRTNRFACSLCSFSSGSIQCYIEHSKLHGILKIESEEAVDKATNDVKFEAIGMNGDNIEVPEDDGNNVSSSSTSLDQLKSDDLPIFKKQKFQEQFGAIIPIIGHLRNAHLVKETG
uniref:C2H2-type domain-containing protein n=1 Tax=Meloidogyne floridensis TaxID=298350 RepID=A0A915P8N8_9BILA